MIDTKILSRLVFGVMVSMFLIGCSGPELTAYEKAQLEVFDEEETASDGCDIMGE